MPRRTTSARKLKAFSVVKGSFLIYFKDVPNTQFSYMQSAAMNLLVPQQISLLAETTIYMLQSNLEQATRTCYQSVEHRLIFSFMLVLSTSELVFAEQ